MRISTYCTRASMSSYLATIATILLNAQPLQQCNGAMCWSNGPARPTSAFKWSRSVHGRPSCANFLESATNERRERQRRAEGSLGVSRI